MNRLLKAAALSLGCLLIAHVSAKADELIGEGEDPDTKIIVKQLKRDEGGTVTLKFQMINDSEKAKDVYHVLAGPLDDKVHLIDAANKKKYLVVKDASGECECTQVKGSVAKDKPVNLWAKFPAPPEDVQKVTVVVSGFAPVESVPITAP
jgi:hypothetical protein